MDVSIADVKIIKKPELAAQIYQDFLMYKKCKKRRDWEQMGEKAARYYYGDQWGSSDKAKLHRQRRAPAVFNRVLPAIDLLVGHQIQGRVDLVARPVDEYSDVEIASFITAAIKNIETSNNATFERRWQFLDGLITGIGVKEIYWDTSENIDGETKVAQGAPWHYYLDPQTEKYQYTDAHKLFKETWMDIKTDVKRIYGKKVVDMLGVPTKEMITEFTTIQARSTWDDNNTDYDNRDMGAFESDDEMLMNYGYDMKRGKVRIVEQYEMVYETVDVVYDMQTKQIRRLDEVLEEERDLFKDFSIPRTFKNVHLTTLIGMDLIVQDVDLQETEFYQLFNFYYPYWFNGKIMGVIENLMYPQDEINKRHSQILHILNSFANTGMFYETGAFPNHVLAELDDLIAQNGATIEVNEGTISQGKIKQIEPHDIPHTLQAIILNEKEDIKDISAASDAISGISQRAQSGAAKDREINQSAVKLLGIIDNFRETQRLEGKAYLHYIQTYWTEERMIRVLGDEGDMQTLEFNKRLFDKIFNDVTIGKYDISLEFEGKTQSERDRNKGMLIELSKTVPEYAPLIAEEIIRLSDVPQKTKLIQKMEQQRQQQAMMQQQMAQMGMQQPNTTRRGPIQSAIRPSRGMKRTPAMV